MKMATEKPSSQQESRRTRPSCRVFYCPKRASRVPAKRRDFCFSKKRNCSQGSPNGNAWTLLAGSVVYGKTPAARASIPSLCWWVARDLIGETGALGCQRWDGLRRTGGERPTHADVAQSVRAPSFQVGGSGFESLYLLQSLASSTEVVRSAVNRVVAGSNPALPAIRRHSSVGRASAL